VTTFRQYVEADLRRSGRLTTKVQVEIDRTRTRTDVPMERW
jgi:hypothetical protein